MSTKSKKKVTKVTKKAGRKPDKPTAKLTKPGKVKPKVKVLTEELQPEGVSRGRGHMGRPVRKSKPATIHIRIAQAKDSETFCGGSHSPIWNRDGDKPLTSVPPQQAAKSTCGRCTRVYDARMRKGKVAS